MFNNALYFEASDGTNGNELWKYDGNNAPSMVADINSGSSSSSPTILYVFMHFILKHTTELTEMNYGNMMEIMLQVVADIYPGSDILTTS